MAKTAQKDIVERMKAAREAANKLRKEYVASLEAAPTVVGEIVANEIRNHTRGSDSIPETVKYDDQEFRIDKDSEAEKLIGEAIKDVQAVLATSAGRQKALAPTKRMTLKSFTFRKGKEKAVANAKWEGKVKKPKAK